MTDITCPMCGTSYPSEIAGECACCGYRLTDDYIKGVVEKQRIEEQIRQQKMAEEMRKRQAELEREAREKKKKAEAERKARLAAEKELVRQKREQERIRILVERNEKNYLRDLSILKNVRAFSKLICLLGVLAVFVVIGCTVFFAADLDPRPLDESLAFEAKAESIYSQVFTSVYFESEGDDIFVAAKYGKGDATLPSIIVKAGNSLSNILRNGRSVSEKLEFMFPRTFAFFDRMTNGGNDSGRYESAVT